MRKSIYYLIANTLSLIVAMIVISAIGKQYPLFGSDLLVNGLKESWEPIKFVVLVEAIAIIVTTQDVVSASEHKKTNTSVPFTTLKNVIMAVVTVVTILYTWVAIYLENAGYAIGDKIAAPYYFISFYCGGVVLMVLSKLFSKKNDTLGASMVFTGLLLIVTGVLYEFFQYWYCLVPCLVVTGLVLVLPNLIAALTKKRA